MRQGEFDQTDDDYADIIHLLETEGVETVILTAVREVLASLAPFIAKLTQLTLTTPFSVDTALRCIAKRTHDGLSAIKTLVESDYAYSAVGLLRPICEDYLYAKFLLTLNREEATDYLRDRVLFEAAAGIETQVSSFTRFREMWGVPKREPTREDIIRLLWAIRAKEIIEPRLKQFGKKLKASNPLFPSISYLAELGGVKNDYDFFYHAASSAVHANPHHMMRMIWGDPATGEVTIDNRNFDKYHRHFALSYGLWLTRLQMDVICSEFPDEWALIDERAYKRWSTAVIWGILVHGSPPIVTEAELEGGEKWQTILSGPGAQLDT